nr:outer membrane beta-barrel protein [Prevotella sp.]
MRNALLFIYMILSCVIVKAQDDPEYRMEIGAGAGLVNYLGDYNGNLFGDLQPMGTIIGRYLFNPTTALRLKVGFGKLKGSSGDVDTYYPDMDEDVMTKADYKFNSTLVDMAMTFEYNFLPYGTGRDYRGSKRLTPYIYIGLGTTYAKCDNDKSTFTFNVPLGIGLKYKLAERVNLGVDYALYFTQSDELDGQKDPYGIKSSGLFKNTDCYSVLGVTLTYSFSAKCVTCNRDDW